jgi:hypothetical protein
MSHPGKETLKRLYDEALEQLEAEHPEVKPSEIEERFGAEAAERANDAFYWTDEGNPTLSVYERNPSL